MVLRSCFLMIAAYYLAPVALGQSLRVETSLGSFEIELLSEFAPPTVATVLPFGTTVRQDKTHSRAPTKFVATTGLSNTSPMTKRSRFFVNGGNRSMDSMYTAFGRDRDMTAASVLFSTSAGEDNSPRNSDDLHIINNTNVTSKSSTAVLTQVAMQVGL